MKDKIIILMLFTTLILTGCQDKDKEVGIVKESPSISDQTTPTIEEEPSPVISPTTVPTPSVITPSPTEPATDNPTPLPSPNITPTDPSPNPTTDSSTSPTKDPTLKPTETPTVPPSKTPTIKPTEAPTVRPSEASKPTTGPTSIPTPTPTVSLLDELLSYQIEIEGETYHLPFSFSKLVSKGWTMKTESNEPFDLSRSLYALESAFVLLSKGDKNISLSLINGGTTQSNKYDEFLVYSISGDVTLPGGITIGSSLDDVLNRYGKPENFKQIDKTWIRLPYITPIVSENKEFHPTKGIELLLEKDKVISIQLNHFDANVEDYVVKADKPFIYTKPKELSNNILDFSFKLGDQYYIIPAPLSEFLDQGYSMKGYSYSELPTIESGTLDNLWKPSKVLAPQSTIYAVLEKGKSVLLLELKNEYDSYQYYKDCTVTKIRFLHSKNGINATLSGGIKLGTTEAELVNILKEQPYVKYTGKQVSGYFNNAFYEGNESWIRYEAYVFSDKLSSSKKYIPYVGSMTYDLLDGKVIDISYHYLNKGNIGTVHQIDLITPHDDDKSRFQLTDEELLEYLCYRGDDYNYWQESNYAMIFANDGSYHAYDAAAGNPWLLLYGDMVDGEASFTVEAKKNQIIIHDYERTITLHYTIGSSFELIIRIDDNPKEYYFYKRH